MPKFTVNGWAAIALYAEIEANSNADAIEKARDLGLPTPASQPYVTGADTWQIDNAHLSGVHIDAE